MILVTGVYNYFTANDYNTTNQNQNKENEVGIQKAHTPNQQKDDSEYVYLNDEKLEQLSLNLDHLQISSIKPQHENSNQAINSLKNEPSTKITGQKVSLEQLLDYSEDREKRETQKMSLERVINREEFKLNNKFLSIWSRMNNQMTSRTQLPGKTERYKCFQAVAFICRKTHKKKLTADNRTIAYGLHTLGREPYIVRPIFKKDPSHQTEGFVLGLKRKYQGTGFQIYQQRKNKQMKVGENSEQQPKQTFNFLRDQTKQHTEICKQLVLEGIGLQNTLLLEKKAAESKKRALALKDDAIIQEFIQETVKEVMNQIQTTSVNKNETIMDKIMTKLANLEKKSESKMEELKFDVRNSTKLQHQDTEKSLKENYEKNYKTISEAVKEMVTKYSQVQEDITSLKDVCNQTSMMSQYSQSSQANEKLIENLNKKIDELTLQIGKLEQLYSQNFSQVSMIPATQQSEKDKNILSQQVQLKQEEIEKKEENKKLQTNLQPENQSNKNIVSFGSESSFPPLNKQYTGSSFESVNLSQEESPQKPEPKKEEPKPPSIQINFQAPTNQPKQDAIFQTKPVETQPVSINQSKPQESQPMPAFQFKPLETQSVTVSQPKPQESQGETKPMQFPATNLDPFKQTNTSQLNIPGTTQVNQTPVPATNSSKISFQPVTTTQTIQPTATTPNTFMAQPMSTPNPFQPASNSVQKNPFLNVSSSSNNSSQNPFNTTSQNQSTLNPFKPAIQFQPSTPNFQPNQNIGFNGQTSQNVIGNVQFQAKPMIQQPVQQTGGLSFNNPFQSNNAVANQNKVNFPVSMNQNSGINTSFNPFTQTVQVNSNNIDSMDTDNIPQAQQQQYNAPQNPIQQMPIQNIQFQAQQPQTMMPVSNQNFTFQPNTQSAFSNTQFMNKQQPTQAPNQITFNTQFNNPQQQVRQQDDGFTIGVNKKNEASDDSLFSTRPIFKAKRHFQR